ncbi:MAG: chromate transporter [Betaproteobacteria bacterium]
MRLLLQMFWSFFKIGAFTFGGGYAMVPLIQKEVVDARKWVGGEEFIDMLGLAQTAPGPVAVNTSVFVGYKTAGFVGAVVAVLGATLPSFLIILAVAIFFSEIRHLPAAEAAFAGVRPAVVALVAGAAYKIGRTAIREVRGVILGAIALVAIVVFDVHPIPVIVGSAAIGYFVFRRDFEAEAEPKPRPSQGSEGLPRSEPGSKLPGDSGEVRSESGTLGPGRAAGGRSPAAGGPLLPENAGARNQDGFRNQDKVVDKQ